MGVKALLVTAIVVAGGAAWYLQDTPAMRSVTSSVKAGAVKAGLTNALPDPVGPKQGTAGLRKCVQGNSVSYVDTACPPGSNEQRIKRNIVTVVSGQAARKPADGSASDAANGDAPKTILERLAPPEKGESLKEKMMNKAIGQ